MLALTIRLIVSLSVVIGLLLLIARFGARRFRGRADSLVQVVHRQALSRTTGVAVISVGSRVLVLGTTENQVTVLTELDPHEIDAGEISLDTIEAAEPLTVAAEALPARPLARPASRPMAPPAPHRDSSRPAARVPQTPPPAPSAAEVILAAAARHEAARSASVEQVELPAALAILAEENLAAPRRTPLTAVPQPSGPLAGSVLSAQTWKQAFAAARGSKQAS